MQKILIATVAMMISVTAIAQKQLVWFDVGLKAQYGFTGLYNSAIADSPEVDYIISSGYGLGGKLGINFGYNGLAIDVIYSKGSQEFDNVMESNKANPNVDYTSVDLYMLYRNAKNLGYFEIGPKFSFVKSVEYSDENGMASDVKNDYNSNYFSGVIGFGANIIGSEGSFTGILGLRFEYGFTDMVSDDGNLNNAPLDINSPLLLTEGKSTNPVFAGIVFEANWGIGYFGVSQCGARPKFMMF